MTTNSNGHGFDKVEVTQLPPGKPNKPYVISSQDGEVFYIPLSKSATRLLVTGKETDNAFAVVGSGGSQSDPIGFHRHESTHDVFLCLQGAVNIWADDKCRTMTPGDFASVPPGVIHQYQILGPHSEFIGLIVPGGWEEFFSFIGEPYAGPMWPMEDNRSFFEVLLPKLKAASEKFDMIPCPEHAQFDPQDWQDTENQLPGGMKPYFLKNGTGPAFAVGGLVCRPLITTAESDGKFSIGSIEGSSQHHCAGLFASEAQVLRFVEVHHAFQVFFGSIEFQLGSSEPMQLNAGQILYIPKNTTFRFRVTSRIAKMYVFANGKGFVELLCKVGVAHSSTILPETASDWDGRMLQSENIKTEFGIQL